MEASDLITRAGSTWDHLRLRRMQQRIDRVEEDRARLRTENRILTDDLHRERAEQDRLMDALEKGRPARRRRRLPRAFVLGGIGAAAYATARSDGARRMRDRVLVRARAARDVAMGRAEIARHEARDLRREVRQDLDELREEARSSVRHIIAP